MSVIATPQFKWNLVFHRAIQLETLRKAHIAVLNPHNIFILQIINYQLRHHNSVH